ncbi:MAG: ABC transporter permease subunit [Pseudomonadota bacterium]
MFAAINIERHRLRKDRWLRYFVGIGGISVIIAITLIFFYLLYVVLPLFSSAEVELQHQYPLQGEQSAYLGLEEQGTMAVRVNTNGTVIFFNVPDGRIVDQQPLNLPASIKTVATMPPNVIALGLANGQALVMRYRFEISYPNDQRTIAPIIEYPLGVPLIDIDPNQQSLKQLAIQFDEDNVGIAAVTDDNRLLFSAFTREQSLFDDEIVLEQQASQMLTLDANINHLLLKADLTSIYTTQANGLLSYYAINDDKIVHRQQIATGQSQITTARFLLGGISLLIGDNQGTIQQWFPVRDQQGNFQLQQIRQFTLASSITTLTSEHRRKGFAAANDQGDIGIFYSTSHRRLYQQKLSDKAIRALAFSPRGKHLLAIDDHNTLYVLKVNNEYPEISWAALWEKIWYEDYQQPAYIWQSSAADNDFEPKLSLVPLSFGTLKGAFYAMLFAIPIGLLGAIFAAQFMAPPMRQIVKPTIETMEALPTVILGFLAGLWLAPYVEGHLPGVFTLLLVLPIGFLLFGWLWQYFPLRNRFDGWQALILVPVILMLGWLSLELSRPMEQLFFAGDMRQWLEQVLGLDYDQRNALVVGVAMGFAVTPTIFSIAEDAIFSVPQHLIRGSLALGATRWQTLVKVILPTASPGIFSAIMMGFGRAVGETMIVLMATGNTAVMDWSIFEGMRTLSANIAVEMPESEVNSTHYRVLFLAALVLFLFTFLFNTVAEIIRQRLREKFSSL